VVSRATQVCVWDCMYVEVESFIRFVCVEFHFVVKSKIYGVREIYKDRDWVGYGA
jgi:hypothetical protein